MSCRFVVSFITKINSLWECIAGWNFFNVNHLIYEFTGYVGSSFLYRIYVVCRSKLDNSCFLPSIFLSFLILCPSFSLPSFFPSFLAYFLPSSFPFSPLLAPSLSLSLSLPFFCKTFFCAQCRNCNFSEKKEKEELKSQEILLVT